MLGYHIDQYQAQRGTNRSYDVFGKLMTHHLHQS